MRTSVDRKGREVRRSEVRRPGGEPEDRPRGDPRARKPAVGWRGLIALTGAAVVLAGLVAMPGCFSTEATCVEITDLGQPYCACKTDNGGEGETVSSCSDAGFPNCCLDPTGSGDGTVACYCTDKPYACATGWRPTDAKNCYTGNTELDLAQFDGETTSASSGGGCGTFYYECDLGCLCGTVCLQTSASTSECGHACETASDCIGLTNPASGDPYTDCLPPFEGYDGTCY